MVFFRGERYQDVIVQLSVREQVRGSNLRVFGKFEDAKHSKNSNEHERAALLRSLAVASNVLQHPLTQSVTLIPRLHDTTGCQTG